MIRARSLVKRFQARQAGSGLDDATFVALHNVDFDVERGQIVSLLGPSGCGKTTLLRILAGLISADEGEVVVNNSPVVGPAKDRCMVFQHFGLLPWRSVVENIEFPLQLDGISKEKRRTIAQEYVDLVGLGGFERHYPHEISGGMQQRVGIARALVRKPLLLLMDEPLGALDAQTREQLQQEFLRIIAVTRNTVLFVTHSIEEAITLSDRIVVMASGPGRVVEIIDRPRDLPDLAKHIRHLLREGQVAA